MDPLQFSTLIIAILIVPTMILAILLTFIESDDITKHEDLYREAQVLWHEVNALNTELVEKAKKLGIDLPMLPRESPFQNLI